MKKMIILGAGGHAKVIIDTARACGVEVVAVFDDDADKHGDELGDVPVKGFISSEDIAPFLPAEAIIGIGINRVRKKIAERLPDLDWATLIHPMAYVAQSASLGNGSIVFAGGIIQPDASLGRHCIVNTGATVDHDCVIGDFVHIAPGANLAGDVSLNEGVFMGIGSAAVNQTSVGAWSTVGAGAVVVHDLPVNVTAIGIPAKPK